MPANTHFGWVDIAVTVPSTHLGSLYAWMGEWLGTDDDIARGNVRHLVPPGDADEPRHLDASFTVPVTRAEEFYGQLASWWRALDEGGHEKPSAETDD